MTTFPRCLATAAVLSCAALVTLSAHAADDREAAGWHKWADFTGAIVAAGLADPFDFGAIVPACDGASGVVTGQGFQFPYWAQNIIMACRVFDTFKDVAEKTRAGVDKSYDKDSIAGMMKTILKRERKILCRNASSASKELGKAEPVEAEPRAQPTALALKAEMDRVMVVGNC
ncbi:MAG: hypothetical protein ABI790_17140 [Betaproteobacteria bacterium]